MKIKKTLITTALLACTFSVAGAAPNVVIFLMDDFGLTDVQEHPTYFPDGSPLYETPNMHRLASGGMRFSNAYAQPLCSASRFSLLSGQYSAARYSLWAAITASSDPDPQLPTSSSSSQAYNFPGSRDHMPLHIETIAERLKAAGYATWHAGKWHLSPHENGSNPNPITNFYPVAHGFDKQLSVGGAGPRPGYFGPFTMPEMNDHNGDPAPGTNSTHIAEHMAGLVQDLIGDHLTNNPTQPFFLYYPTYSVHGPHEAKKSVFNKYVAKLASLPNSKHQHPVMAAMIEGVDAELGALLDYMDTKALTDNTLFIFVSDNGALTQSKENCKTYDDISGTYAVEEHPAYNFTPISNNDPRKGGKASIYEGGLRIPMIVRYPDGSVVAGGVSEEPVHLIDIYQTILDYTPAAPKAGYTLDGVSLKPALEQTGSLPARELFHYFPGSDTTFGSDPDNPNPGKHPGGAAVLNFPHKMIATYSTAHDAATIDYMLYRLDTDQSESNNIAGLFPDVVDAMRTQLGTFYTNTSAFVPTPNPSYDGASYDSPELTIDNFLADAGLTLLTPDTFMIADPDNDNRDNRQEFLQQTGPNTSDAAVATIWLYDDGGAGELRFALPANTDQSAYSILDQTGAVAFTVSDLELDGQYGSFFIYRPTNSVPSPDPGDYTISVADAPFPQSTADLTVDYRALLSGTESFRMDTLQLDNNLLVDTGSGLEVVQNVTVTTTGVSGDIRNGGPNGLAVVGGLNDVWFDSGEKIDLEFALETTGGTTVTNLQLKILDVGARAVDGETMTLSNQSVLATASWTGGTGANGRPGILAGTFDFMSDETLNIQTGPTNSASQKTQLSYLTFRISDSTIDNTDTDGDLLPDAYEDANGLNKNNPADGNADGDNDGWTRGQEYVAGTSDSDENDFFTIGIDGQELTFNVNDRRAYRLYKRTTLYDPAVLVEDFGVISGNHSVQLQVMIDGETEFYHLEAYLP